jgi:protease-4
MQKRPFLMAVLLFGAIFLFFILMVYAISSFMGRPATLSIGKKVGVIEVTGVIATSKEIIEQLTDFRDDNGVRAIVLRIDSPGGGVGPSQEIFAEVRKADHVKPVVVSMGSVAASGGYYIAVPARRILANPGSITGSIGVIMEFTNFQELLQKIGLKSDVIKSGEHKDIGSPIRPLSASDRNILQTMIDDVHAQFVDAVAEGRKMEPDAVRALADGRIFTGRQALAAGLVDELGNLQDAIDVAATLAGIEGKPGVIYPRREKTGILDYLIQETISQLRHGLQEHGSAGLSYIWSGID